MKSIKCILLISTCLFLPKESQAEINLTFDVSNVASSNPTLHTHHTPVELKPISVSNSAIKLAAVCALGGGGCNIMGFNTSNNDTDLDTDKQCNDSGFNLTECPQGQIPNFICPTNNNYFQSCTCDTDYYAHKSPYECGQQSYVSSLLSCSDNNGTYYRCDACASESGGNIISLSSCKSPNTYDDSSLVCLDDNTNTKYIMRNSCQCPSSYKLCNINNNEVGYGQPCQYSSYGENSTFYQSCNCPSDWSTCVNGGEVGARKCTLNGIDYWSDCKTCPENGTFTNCPIGYICELEECSGKYYKIGCEDGYVSSDGFQTCIWGGGCLELNNFTELYNQYYSSNCDGIKKTDCLNNNSGKNFCPNGCTNAKSAFGGIYATFVGSACSINTTKLCSLCTDNIDCSEKTNITVPTNATCSKHDSDCPDICTEYKCNSGYNDTNGICSKDIDCSEKTSITIPSNATCSRYNSNCPSVCESFKCNSGYKNITYGEICRACSEIPSITIPSNATCSKYDSDCPNVCTEYKCNSGYDDTDNECSQCITESDVQTKLGNGEYIFRTTYPQTTFCNVSWKKYLCGDKSTLIFGCKTAPDSPSIEYDENGFLTTNGAIGWIKSHYCAGANKKAQCLSNYNNVVLSRTACTNLSSDIYGENYSKYIGSMCSFNKNVCDWCLDLW